MQFEPTPAAVVAGLLPLRIHSAIAGQFPPTLSAAADCSSPASGHTLRELPTKSAPQA